MNSVSTDIGRINPASLTQRRLPRCGGRRSMLTAVTGAGQRRFIHRQPDAGLRGMIVGEAKQDIQSTSTKKHLTAIHSTGADEALILTPPIRMSLEETIDTSPRRLIGLRREYSSQKNILNTELRLRAQADRKGRKSITPAVFGAAAVRVFGRREICSYVVPKTHKYQPACREFNIQALCKIITKTA